jgi:excisionase family DNA binding protein
MLGVSRDTIERMIKQGKLKATRKNPLAGKTSALLIPASEVERVKKLMKQ